MSALEPKKIGAIRGLDFPCRFNMVLGRGGSLSAKSFNRFESFEPNAKVGGQKVPLGRDRNF